MAEEVLIFDIANDKGDVIVTRYFFDMLIKEHYSIERVRELHKRVIEKGYECGDGCCWQPNVDDCEECVMPYPCDTIKALDGEQ